MSDNIADTRTITLLSGDKKEVSILRRAIRRAGTIEQLIQHLNLDENEGSWEPIPLPNVNEKILKLIVEYCTHEVDAPIFKEYEDSESLVVSDWVGNFLTIDDNDLHQLMLAANYLHMPCLLRSISQTVAAMIRGKSTEEIRSIFNITNDYTSEEEATIKKENAWCEM